MPLTVSLKAEEERKDHNVNEKFKDWGHCESKECLRVKVKREEEREDCGQSEKECGQECVRVKVERENDVCEESKYVYVDVGIKEERGRSENKVGSQAGLDVEHKITQEPVAFPVNAGIQIEVDLVKQEPMHEDEMSSHRDLQAEPSQNSYNSRQTYSEPMRFIVVKSEDNNFQVHDCQIQKDATNLQETVPGKRGRKPKENAPGNKRVRKPKDGPPRKRGRPRKEPSERKAHTCDTCSKRFVQRKSLTIHLRTHTGERPFPCTDCGKNFISSAQLVSHSRVHAIKNPLVCQICSKQFMHKCNLMRHLQVHTGEKHYACNNCQKTFLRSSNLKCHMRTHTGERPYSCPVCEKLFKQRHDLTSHLRLHTGEKPFGCKLCSKRFVDSSALYKHKRVHIKRGHAYPQT